MREGGEERWKGGRRGEEGVWLLCPHLMYHTRFIWSLVLPVARETYSNQPQLALQEDGRCGSVSLYSLSTPIISFSYSKKFVIQIGS